jgi:hypothetical protein
MARGTHQKAFLDLFHSTIIDLSTMAYLYNDNYQLLVFDLVDYSINTLSYAVAFKAGKLFTADGTGVIGQRLYFGKNAFNVSLWDRL